METKTGLGIALIFFIIIITALNIFVFINVDAVKKEKQDTNRNMLIGSFVALGITFILAAWITFSGNSHSRPPMTSQLYRSSGYNFPPPQ